MGGDGGVAGTGGAGGDGGTRGDCWREVGSGVEGAWSVGALGTAGVTGVTAGPRAAAFRGARLLGFFLVGATETSLQ